MFWIASEISQNLLIFVVVGTNWSLDGVIAEAPPKTENENASSHFSAEKLYGGGGLKNFSGTAAVRAV